VRIRTVGLSWTSWSGGYTDQVLYSNGWASLTIDFASPVTGFGFFTEPRVFAVYTINMLLSDGSSVSGDYDGASGAGFLGFLGEGVTSATISSADDFAIGDFYTTVAAGAVPEPAAWAMMIAGFGLVGASLRRRKPLIGAV